MLNLKQMVKPVRSGTTKEEWRDIPEYEGIYQISNLGRVKSLERRVAYRNGGTRLVKTKILKSNKTPNGYLKVVLAQKRSRYTVLIHHLMSIAFLNHTPSGGSLVVDHKDDDKLNNNKDNLQIITIRENRNKSILKKSSKYPGVTWHSRDKVWQARIQNLGKRKHLGYFKSEQEAHNAYKNELKLLNEK